MASLTAVAVFAVLAALPAVADGTSEQADEARFRRAAELRGLALADMEEANYGRAVERLTELERLLPDNVLPPVDLAICYLKLNQPEQALAAVDRAAALRPDNPQVLYTVVKVLEWSGARDPAVAERREQALARFEQAHPADPRPYYLRARALDEAGQTAEALTPLQAAVTRDPENLVLLADRLVAAAFSAHLDATADALDAIEDRLDGFEGFDPRGNLEDYAERLRDSIEAEDPTGLRPPALVMRNLLRPSELYQLGLVPLTGGRQQGGTLFPQQDFDPPLPKSIQGGQDIELRFTDATEESGLAQMPQKVHLALARQPEPRETLVGLNGTEALVIELLGGQARARQIPIQPPTLGSHAAYDFDQDGQMDLMVATATEVRLFAGDGKGGFSRGRTIYASSSESSSGTLRGGKILGVYPLEIDHDGDLDLFLACEGTDRYLQNNGDGSWSERAVELGIAGISEPTTDIEVADFDDDGDLDLLTVHPRSHPRLYDNRRAGALREVSRSTGLSEVPVELKSLELLDFDRDGRFDLLLWGAGGARLLRNLGGRFESMPLPRAEAPWAAATAADFDNDGDPDIIVALAGSNREDSVLMLRNRRTRWVAEPTGLTNAGMFRAKVEDNGDRFASASPLPDSLVPGDFDGDGDLDLFAQDLDGAPRFWRNDGGNRNHWLRLGLRGMSDNNSKNNTQGLFARIETRVGDELQTLPGNGGINHIGLGASRQADVVRVVWTNGLAQTWQLVSADRTLVEEQVLKGSCPFLYTFDGEGFRFVTDLMWRSPLGMVMPDGSEAPHQPARDWVLVPGEVLKPAGGKLWLQVTEELWEAAYVDRQYLLVADHPAGTELLVDERVTPPPYPTTAPLHLVDRQLAPVAAHDHHGSDVLAKILRRDGDHVDDLPLDRYQGLTRGHALTVTFEGVPAGERLRLLLQGWTFPTDSSINFALAQDSSRDPYPPRLELLRPDGSWQELEGSIGFPAGKRKTMVLELTDRLPAGTVTLRIATSMQVYWDRAALAVGDPGAPDRAAPSASPLRLTRLEPEHADLHDRGFSRLYRESPTGPHLFDYRQVTVDSPFRPMLGQATAAGPVTHLLAAEDDRSVVMIAGHEMTVTYDATALPLLPAGWRRDYILYTDGWVKDADIHTAHGQTIGPLPRRDLDGYR